jgi:hypothetical protein
MRNLFVMIPRESGASSNLCWPQEAEAVLFNFGDYWIVRFRLSRTMAPT